jgi:hypothetical protein
MILMALISSSRRDSDFFPGTDLASNRAFFLLGSHNCFVIGHVVVASATIVTPHFIRIFSFAHPYATVNSFLLSKSRTGAGPFKQQMFPKFSKRIRYVIDFS